MSSEICRICLKENDKLLSLFQRQEGEEYYKKIIYFTNVDIAQDDKLPSKICDCCVSELSVSYNFVIKCQESDKYLRECKSYLNIVIKNEEESSQEYGISDDNSVEVKESRKVNRKSIKKEKTEKKIIICSECGLSVASKAALTIHMRKHTGERPYACPHCNMSFSQTGTMKVHILRRHSSEPRHLRERPFTCNICNGKFFSNRDLTVHIRRHTGDHPYECDVCKQNFTQLGSLIRHKRIHSGERPFHCKLCPKKFIDSNLLRKHQYTHISEKRFMCPVCGKAIKSKHGLDIHLAIHKEGKVICEVCGVSKSTRGNLRTHMKARHSEKSGQCCVCNKLCSDLKAHMRKHTGEKAFICSVCGDGFPLKLSLAVHMNKHKAVNNKFTCDRSGCFSKFAKKTQLDGHILKMHSNKSDILNIPLSNIKKTFDEV